MTIALHTLPTPITNANVDPAEPVDLEDPRVLRILNSMTMFVASKGSKDPQKHLLVRIDREDEERVLGPDDGSPAFQWSLKSAAGGRYRFAVRHGPRIPGLPLKKREQGRELLYLHREVLGLERQLRGTGRQRVEFINGDGLDCRKCNLRVLSTSRYVYELAEDGYEHGVKVEHVDTGARSPVRGSKMPFGVYFNDIDLMWYYGLLVGNHVRQVGPFALQEQAVLSFHVADAKLRGTF